VKGDRLIIETWHIKAARQTGELLLPLLTGDTGRFIITIAGESGSGKSEVAAALADVFSEQDISSVILQQDDYFVYPPGTNEEMRRKNIAHVGLSEVRLDLLDRNLEDILEGRSEITTPLVIFEEDRITGETTSLEGVRVVIVEGTYTTTLKNVHRRVFIDRTYIDTREKRKLRAREIQDAFLEQVLEIEHDIISSHRSRADIIITRDYDAQVNDAKEGT
jgi:uridine kinase